MLKKRWMFFFQGGVMRFYRQCGTWSAAQCQWYITIVWHSSERRRSKTQNKQSQKERTPMEYVESYEVLRWSSIFVPSSCTPKPKASNPDGIGIPNCQHNLGNSPKLGTWTGPVLSLCSGYWFQTEPLPRCDLSHPWSPVSISFEGSLTISMSIAQGVLDVIATPLRLVTHFHSALH